MNSTAAPAAAAAAGTVVGYRPPFTATQWEELEHQALIFKYMMAGIPVPPELLLPIQRSYDTMVARLYSHPALGYCSYYGKKVDPEPGRCRRTDGKKWRCSKDAYPDSKYCERHMHRGRNRSRKHVESPQTLSQSQSQSQSSFSTVTSLVSSAGSSGSGGGSSATASPASSGGCGRSSLAAHHHSVAPAHPPVHSHCIIDQAAYGATETASMDIRYLYESKSGNGERGLFSEASGSMRGFCVESSLDNPWRLMPSSVSAFPSSRDSDRSFMHGSFPKLQPLQDLGQVTINSMPKNHHYQQHHSFFGSEFGSSEASVKTEQSLRPFFDEWPRTRDTWSDVEEERSNRASFSTTQLSISIPMSSDFSASSLSPNG